MDETLISLVIIFAVKQQSDPENIWELSLKDPKYGQPIHANFATIFAFLCRILQPNGNTFFNERCHLFYCLSSLSEYSISLRTVCSLQKFIMLSEDSLLFETITTNISLFVICLVCRVTSVWLFNLTKVNVLWIPY